jgi:transcriptional regulator with XRE-family HTH domain
MGEIEEEEEYSIKKSAKSVGPLYPVLIDGKGRIIDGHHRLREDPNWPVFKLDNIRTRTQFLMARLIANLHRRHMTEEEKREMLAELKKETGWSNKKIAQKLGVSIKWILKYLPEEFKDSTKVRAGKASASVRLISKNVPVPQRRTTEKLKEEFDVPPPPEEALVYNPEIDDSIRFVESLDMWFMKPGDPVLLALIDYCKTKRIHWKILVRSVIEKFLREEGFLKD